MLGSYLEEPSRLERTQEEVLHADTIFVRDFNHRDVFIGSQRIDRTLNQRLPMLRNTVRSKLPRSLDDFLRDCKHQLRALHGFGLQSLSYFRWRRVHENVLR